MFVGGLRAAAVAAVAAPLFALGGPVPVASADPGVLVYVTCRDPHLTTVTPTDWTMLRAIARRVLCVAQPAPFRHPSVDEYWEVQRSAIRLAGYLTSAEMVIQVLFQH